MPLFVKRGLSLCAARLAKCRTQKYTCAHATLKDRTVKLVGECSDLLVFNGSWLRTAQRPAYVAPTSPEDDTNLVTTTRACTGVGNQQFAALDVLCIRIYSPFLPAGHEQVRVDVNPYAACRICGSFNVPRHGPPTATRVCSWYPPSRVARSSHTKYACLSRVSLPLSDTNTSLLSGMFYTRPDTIRPAELGTGVRPRAL